MAMKRKFESEMDDAAAACTVKQLKLFPFPSTEMSSDVAMSDASSMDIEFSPHSRLSSGASSCSASSPSTSPSSPYYPAFELYPFEPSHNNPGATSQPPTDSWSSHRIFTHRTSDSRRFSTKTCTQIPKLRIACESGASGQRSMWAMCEECGAVQMVDS